MLKDATNRRGHKLRLATGTEGLSIWGDAILQEPEVSALLEELWKWLGKEQSEQTVSMIEVEPT